MKTKHGWYAAWFSAAVLGSLAGPGCGGGQAETGTQVQVTDQMQKEAEASANYLDSQSKKPAASRK